MFVVCVRATEAYLDDRRLILRISEIIFDLTGVRATNVIRTCSIANSEISEILDLSC